LKNRRAARQVAARGQQHIDDLAVLVDRPVQIGPSAGYPHVRLIDEPAVTRSVAAQAGSLDELGTEPLHPAIDVDVVHNDAALGQQLIDIAVGQAVAQVPAHRDRDHLPRKPEASKH
jgi:hypothetical protein